MGGTILGVIIFLYILAWIFKGIRFVLYWTFSAMGEWACERVSESRYRKENSSTIIFLIARPFDIAAHIYRLAVRIVRDHVGTYLLTFFIFFILWYQTAIFPDKGLYAYLFLALFTVLLFPTFFLSRFSEPLGLVRSSYYLGQLAAYSYRHYHQSGPLFSAIITWKRGAIQKQCTSQQKWLSAKLQRCNPNEIGTLVCRFLVSDKSRSEEEIIALLQSFYFINPILCPGRLYRKAGLLLLAIESQRGNWKNVRKWSALWLKKAPSAQILFFNLVAQRMEYSPVTGNSLLLCFTCIICLKPSYFPIALLALQRKPKDIGKILTILNTATPDRQTGLKILSTISESRHLQKNKVILHRLACYFEEILQTECHTAAKNREAENHIDDLEEVLSSTLSKWHEEAEQTAEALEQNTLIIDVSSNREETLMESIGYQARALENRFRQDNYINTEFEWQEWAAVMTLYEQAATTPHLQYQAFHKLVPVCWDWSAWLNNSHHERSLAAAIFRWIRHEALHFEDHDTVSAMDSNLRRA